MARKYQLHGAFPSKAGDSAYQVAQKNGFEGTEQEWLDSLVGKQGPQGPAGKDAETVDLSAYIKQPDKASVGQTIVVKEVDENGKPLAWEAGAGLSNEAKALLITILCDGRYSNDQSANIEALKAELGIEVSVSYISASYNGGNAAVGTNLTDLTDIVVTAHYSDGTTEIVTEYVLSGEIAEGENIIVVTYEGLTTTFIVIGEEDSTVFEFPLVQGAIFGNSPPGYIIDRANRASYAGVDCKLTPGKTYRLTGVSGVRYGIQTITQTGYENIQNGSVLSDGSDKIDSGWKSSGYEFVASETAVCAWLTASFASGDITPEQAMPVYLEEVA